MLNDHHDIGDAPSYKKGRFKSYKKDRATKLTVRNQMMLAQTSSPPNNANNQTETSILSITQTDCILDIQDDIENADGDDQNHRDRGMI